MPTREGELQTGLWTGDVEITTTRPNQTQSLLNSLLARTNKLDPVMVTILQEMLNELKAVELAVFPPPDIPKIGGGSGDGGGDIINPDGFTYDLTPTAVFLQWIPPSSDFFYYELRKGTNWDTADKILTTTNSQVVLEPLLVGTHTYLLKTIGDGGVPSQGTSRVDIIIPPISNFVITPVVVANAITLGWTVPVSVFKIDYYEIRRNGILIATNTGTFFAISEQAGGNYTYSVTAVDVAGNKSPEVTTNITTTGVTDYIFYSRKDWTRTGTIVNGKKSGNEIYYCILNETYQNHFSSRGWNSPAAQVSAGYTPWLSPFGLTGSYEEIFDFGTAIQNVILTIGWEYQLYYGNFIFGLQSSYSTDGVNYSPTETTQSYFASSLRYVKVKVNVTAQNDKSLMSLKNVFVSLNVKRENDGGEGTSLASDTFGTVVNFKKVFVDVEGITVTPASIFGNPNQMATFAIHEFSDTPYPTSFKVKIFDNSGVRVTRDFRWNARGIV